MGTRKLIANMKGSIKIFPIDFFGFYPMPKGAANVATGDLFLSLGKYFIYVLKQGFIKHESKRVLDVLGKNKITAFNQLTCIVTHRFKVIDVLGCTLSNMNISYIFQ